MNGPGFFALDRAQMRSAMEELGGGPTYWFFVVLAADCRDGCMTTGNVRDLSEYYGCSLRSMRSMLTDLDERGWIEWQPPQNQTNVGSIRIVRDLENVKRPKQPAVAPKWRDGPPESGAPPHAKVTGAERFADAPPPRRPDAAPTAASTPPPSEVTGATRGNAVHQEPRTWNQEPEPNALVQPSAEPMSRRANLIEASLVDGTSVLALKDDEEISVEMFHRRARECEGYRNRIARRDLQGTALEERQCYSVAGLLAFGKLADLDQHRSESDVRRLVDDPISASYETWLLAVFDALGLDVTGHDGWAARTDVYMPMTRPIAWDIEHARQWRNASEWRSNTDHQRKETGT